MAFIRLLRFWHFREILPKMCIATLPDVKQCCYMIQEENAKM